MRVVKMPEVEIEPVTVDFGPCPPDWPKDVPWQPVQRFAGRRTCTNAVIDFEGDHPPLHVKIPCIEAWPYVLHGVIPCRTILDYESCAECTVDHITANAAPA